MSEEKKAMADGTEEEEEDEREPEEERVEEKAPAKPAGPVGPFVAFNRGVRAWAVVAALLVGVGVYFIPIPGLSKPLGGLRLGSHAITFMLLVGAAVAAAAGWALFRFGRPHFDWRKPGQGRYVRLTAYLGIAAFASFAGVTVHQVPSLKSLWWEPLWGGTLLGMTFTLRPIFFPAAATTMLALLGFHLWANRPKWADLLTETQSELRKVSWPPHKEWIGSSVVVMIVIGFVSVFLYIVDRGLSHVLEQLKIGF